MFVSSEILKSVNPLEAVIYVTICRMQNRHFEATKFHTRYIGKAVLHRDLTAKETELFEKCLANLHDRFQCTGDKHPDRYKQDLQVRVAILDTDLKAMSRGLWFQLKAGKEGNFNVTDELLEILLQELTDAELLKNGKPVYEEEKLTKEMVL